MCLRTLVLFNMQTFAAWLKAEFDREALEEATKKSKSVKIKASKTSNENRAQETERGLLASDSDPQDWRKRSLLLFLPHKHWRKKASRALKRFTGLNCAEQRPAANSEQHILQSTHLDEAAAFGAAIVKK